MSNITYYKKNRHIILNRERNIIKRTKNFCENEQTINIDHYQKMRKI